MEILLTKSTTPIIGWIAQLLGWIMNGIYLVLDSIGIPNIGLAIILYTIIVYLLMTPLQIKQQKSSKMMSVINPEMQKINAKYKGKTDQASRMKMQEETMALYDKYGVSMSGNCVLLGIQFPLIIALYTVIYKIPAYITSVGATFGSLADKIMSIDGYSGTLKNFLKEITIRFSVPSGDFTHNQVVDALYLLKPSQWDQLSHKFSSLSAEIESTKAFSTKINEFAGINISESPWDVIKSSFTDHAWLLLIIALFVPFLAWFTQWLNFKLMPQAGAAGNLEGTAGNTMKTMNNIMPIFSAVMCMTFSMGIGIYWIIGAIVRCVQQVVINRRIAKMDVDILIEKAKAKQAKKKLRRREAASTATSASIQQSARKNLKRIEDPRFKNVDQKDVNYAENAVNAHPDSITAKANMVARFDEKNEKKPNKTNRNKRRDRAANKEVEAAANTEAVENTEAVPKTEAVANAEEVVEKDTADQPERKENE